MFGSGGPCRLQMDAQGMSIVVGSAHARWSVCCLSLASRFRRVACADLAVSGLVPLRLKITVLPNRAARQCVSVYVSFLLAIEASHLELG